MFVAYKAYIVITILGLATFWLAKKNLPEFVSRTELQNWRNIWVFLITAACFSPNVWVFYAVFVVLVVNQVPKNPQKRIFYYLFLLCTAPQLNIIIPGIAGLPWLFPLSYSRLAIIVLLLYVYFKTPSSPKLFKLNADKYIVSFVLLLMVLKFRDDTFTNGIRQSFVLFIDIFIPYFVLSRHIQTQTDLNKAFYVLLIGILPLAIIGIFETAKSWLLFSDIYKSLMDQGIFYDVRSGGVRAVASTSGGPVLGFIMVVSFGLFLYIKPFIKSPKLVYLAGFLIILCLLATKARGPWLGIIVLIAAYLYTGKAAIKNIFKLSAIGLALVPVLMLTPAGQKFIDLLPFVGDARSDTIDYRSRLIDNSWIVFQQNPWFGSTTFLETPEMQSMMQGEGIIDIVNSYIQIVLENGIIGLLLFLLIFFNLLRRNYAIINKLPASSDELQHMGRTFLALTVAIMFIIFTISSVNFIPVLYWVFIGLLAAYLKIAETELKQSESAVPNQY
jgi:O-antigen ligase